MRKREIDQKTEYNPESEQIQESLKKVLSHHVADHEVGSFGRRELLSSIAGAAVGVKEVTVDRPTPKLEISSATLIGGKSRALVGPNGAGKSTFFDAVMGRGASFGTESGKGAVVFGKPVHGRERLRISRLDQEELLGAMNDLVAREVLEQAMEYYKNQLAVHWDDPEKYDDNMKNQESQDRINGFLEKVKTLFEINDFMDRKVKELSGGERTKLALSMVMLSEPDVLLLDEPTNHLDLPSISKLMGLFKQYQHAGVAIVSASHVGWFLEDAGRDGVLEVSWDGEKRWLKESKSPYEKYIKNKERGTECIISGDIEWRSEGYDYKRGLMVIDAPQEFTIPDSPLKKVSIPTISGGELVVISGKNGTGKTKLMESVLSMDKIRTPHPLKGIQVAYLPQFWPEEVAGGTIGDFYDWIRESTTPHEDGFGSAPFVRIAKKLQFGVGSRKIGEAWLQTPLAKLSGGEQRTLWFLAVSSLQAVDVLLLDEPTNHMDLELQKKITNAIKTFPGAVVLSSHDRNLFRELSRDGGTVQGVIRKPTHLVLEKVSGSTHVTKSTESPMDYAERIIYEGANSARRVQVR